MRCRSRERMVDEWNKQKCMKRADNRATDIDLQRSFEIRLQKPIRIQTNPKQHLKLYKV